MIIYFLGFKSLQRSLSRHPFPPPFSIAFDYLTKSHLSLSGVTKETFFPHRIKTFEPFSPLHKNAYSPYCSLQVSHVADKENLSNNQELY